MKTLFRNVVMVPDQPEIAKVNRKSGTLYLSSKIWKGLPSDQKEFVLHHEDGHLRLDTADEFQANKYAVNKFLGPRSFTNKELGQKIVVMREILSKADETAGFTGIADAVAGATGGILQSLSVLGVGSKSRQQEAAANAAAASQLYTAQATAAAAKSKSTLIIIGVAGAIIIFGLIIYLKLRKK